MRNLPDRSGNISLLVENASHDNRTYLLLYYAPLEDEG
jgi:hypothetical protein